MELGRRRLVKGPLVTAMAAAAVVGGGLWVVKGMAIVLGYGQPDYAFEIAPLLLALVTLGLARQLPAGVARQFGTTLAVIAVLSCGVAAVSYVASGDVLGPDLAVGTLATTAALVTIGIPLRRNDMAVGRLPLILGAGTVPAVAAAGALSFLDERLLEIPIVMIGITWMIIGGALLRRQPIRPLSR